MSKISLSLSIISILSLELLSAFQSKFFQYDILFLDIYKISINSFSNKNNISSTKVLLLSSIFLILASFFSFFQIN